MKDTQSSRLGIVTLDGDNAVLAFERRLHHPIEAVWKAITEPKELSKWHLQKANVEGEVGGAVEFFSGNDRVTGNVLAWEPPRVFEHEWKVDRPGFPLVEYGVIKWELIADGDSTILKLTHRDLTKQSVYNFAPGSHALLDRLEAHLDGTPPPDWRSRSEELRKIYSQLNRFA